MTGSNTINYTFVIRHRWKWYVVRHNIRETGFHCFLALTWTDLDLPSTGPWLRLFICNFHCNTNRRSKSSSISITNSFCTTPSALFPDVIYAFKWLNSSISNCSVSFYDSCYHEVCFVDSCMWVSQDMKFNLGKRYRKDIFTWMFCLTLRLTLRCERSK